MCEYGCETLWDSLCYSYNILFSLHTDESEMERLFVHVTGITWQLYEYYYMNGYMHMLVCLSVYFLPGCWMYMCKMRIFFISKHSHSYLCSNVLGRVCERNLNKANNASDVCFLLFVLLFNVRFFQCSWYELYLSDGRNSPDGCSLFILLISFSSCCCQLTSFKWTEFPLLFSLL